VHLLPVLCPGYCAQPLSTIRVIKFPLFSSTQTHADKQTNREKGKKKRKGTFGPSPNDFHARILANFPADQRSKKKKKLFSRQCLLSHVPPTAPFLRASVFSPFPSRNTPLKMDHIIWTWSTSANIHGKESLGTRETPNFLRLGVVWSMKTTVSPPSSTSQTLETNPPTPPFWGGTADDKKKNNNNKKIWRLE
jgi:hypothetical protein